MKNFFKKLKQFFCCHDKKKVLDIYPEREFVFVEGSTNTVALGKAKLCCQNCGKIWLSGKKIMVKNGITDEVTFKG